MAQPSGGDGEHGRKRLRFGRFAVAAQQQDTTRGNLRCQLLHKGQLLIGWHQMGDVMADHDVKTAIRQANGGIESLLLQGATGAGAMALDGLTTELCHLRAWLQQGEVGVAKHIKEGEQFLTRPRSHHKHAPGRRCRERECCSGDLQQRVVGRHRATNGAAVGPAVVAIKVKTLGRHGVTCCICTSLTQMQTGGMVAALLILLVIVAVAAVLNPSRDDFGWFLRLRRPRWLTFERWIPLIWIAIYACFYASALLSWNSSSSFVRMAGYLVLLVLVQSYTWLICTTRRLASGTAVGFAGWLWGVALAVLVAQTSTGALLLLVPYLLWSPVGTFVTWQMQRLNRDAHY